METLTEEARTVVPGLLPIFRRIGDGGETITAS
jgi:hypothetical protein